LERWLEGHTILARPATPIERAWRWTRRNRTVAALSGALLVALLSVFGLFAYHRSQERPAVPSVPAKSVAILPFENLSRDADNAYFAQGVQEEILTRLGKIADLKVISPTERFQCATGERFRSNFVANILTGSIAEVGDQVRIVQLLDAAGTHLWTERSKGNGRFSGGGRGPGDCALQAKLSAEVQAIARRPTEAHSFTGALFLEQDDE
jgi:TolB-like protein